MYLNDIIAKRHYRYRGITAFPVTAPSSTRDLGVNYDVTGNAELGLQM